jgi:hypothetical protein
MNPRLPRGILPLIGLSLALVAAPARSNGPGPSADEFFERDVRPILVERCGECHGDLARPKGGLRLTSRAELLRGGESGPAAVPGKPEESLLVEAIRYLDEPRMPPKQKLPEREVETLTRWVALGLPWPESRVAPSTATPTPTPSTWRITDEQRRFWSFQPVRDTPPPEVRDSAWPRSAIDRYLLAALEARGLKPAPQASKRTLIRRATFDLTGLPPTPEEVDAFLADDSSDAFARLVDRLLASPHYGERWGRHWLDLVRYADSFDARGVGSEGDIANAWRYRDWVVEAFNRDLPYDQFILQQIAGDLLPAEASASREGIIATGLLAIGNWGGGDADKEKLLTDIADDQVDVVSRAFLGLTVACARCHDHKFDPISQKDYYGLAGIFFSTHILPNVGPKTNGPPMLHIPLESAAERSRREEHARRVADLEGRIKRTLDTERQKLASELVPQTASYVAAALDYAAELNRPALAEFAAARGLHPFALQQWSDTLGLSGEFPFLTKALRDISGRPGIHAWKGDPDCPSLTVNATDQEAAITTLKLPPRSVAVHPGPSNGVVVGWKSPIAGKVRITGRVVDADPVGGDGIAWAIDHRRNFTRELASGAFPNGGSQAIAGPTLASVAVEPGDLVQLLVLPKNGHTCDTTVVELTILPWDGSAAWDLTRDLVADALQGNPHADRLGHADVWRFEDMADRPRPRDLGVDLASPLTRDPQALDALVRKLRERPELTGPVSPFLIRKEADESALAAPARASLAALRSELAALKGNPPPAPTFAEGAQDGGVPGSPHAGVHDVRVHIRGSYSRLGDLVPRHFPVILAGESQPTINSGSGRLELARWLTRPDHVLTARVMVNRIWQYHFGAGIVRTPSNFGKLGEHPSHPELLDHLARRFVAEGWSIKRLHREIMLSSAYHQASEADPETRKADPDNRLFGRMNRRRLEAEAIRDSLLAVSGRLNRTRGGLATRDFNNPRRTLYLMTIRSDRSSFGPLFDAADSTAMVDRRIVSTVAPQALFLLNNAFVLNQAEALAKRVRDEPLADDPARIDWLYTLLYGRPPDDEERRISRDLLSRGGAPEAAWTAYCQVLLCANEFIYVD